MVPLVTVWLIWGWRDTRVLWICLMIGYAIVNLCYFLMIWGKDFSGKKFVKEDPPSKSDSRLASTLQEDKPFIFNKMSTPFFLREDDNELYSSKERKYHELKESLLYDKANKGKLKKKHSPSSSTTDNLSSSGEE